MVFWGWTGGLESESSESEDDVYFRGFDCVSCCWGSESSLLECSRSSSLSLSEALVVGVTRSWGFRLGAAIEFQEADETKIKVAGCLFS